MPATVDITCANGQLRPNAKECVNNLLCQCKLSGYGQPGRMFRIVATPRRGLTSLPYDRFTYDLLVGNSVEDATMHVLNSIENYHLWGHLLTFGFASDTTKLDMQRETFYRLQRFDDAPPTNRRRPC